MRKPRNESLTQLALRFLLRKSYLKVYSKPIDEAFKSELANSSDFFLRFQNKVNFQGKTVLDIGCGLGSLCYYMALNGAIRVVGIDINKNSIDFAKSKLKEYPLNSEVLAFGLPEEIECGNFDLVVSKDSFEHYEDPEVFIVIMLRCLKPGGKLVIGFSPLWKSPYGGHITALMKWPLPWVHLIFPEHVLISELRRFLQDDNVKSFEQIAGGLNKMTLQRYLHIVEGQRLEIEYMRLNVGLTLKDRFVLSLFKILCFIPSLREYFTVNIYSILCSKNR